MDPLLTAAVSGPGNFTRITTGALCLSCAVQDLTTQNEPIWTVTHGAPYTSRAPITFTNAGFGGLTISCARSAIAGVFPDEIGPLRSGIASVQWTRIAGCTGSDGSQWTITQRGTASYGPDEQFGPGFTFGNIDDLEFEFTGTGTGAPGQCSILAAGPQNTIYTDHGSVLSVVGAATLNILRSTCPDAPADSSTNAAGDFSVSATYRLRPGGMAVSQP